MSELNPCPFCGDRAELECTSEKFVHFKGYQKAAFAELDMADSEPKCHDNRAYRPFNRQRRDF